MRLKTNKGFTLIELLVVVAIIGLLATMVAVSLTSARSRARDARRVSDIRQIENALELYYAAFTTYPTDLNILLTGSGRTGYLNLKDLPNDPQGRSYCYAYGIDDPAPPIIRYNYYHIGARLENLNSDLLTADLDASSTDVANLVNWSQGTPIGAHCQPITGGGFNGSDAGGIYDRGVFPNQ